MQRIEKIRGDNTDEDIYVFEFESGNRTPGIRLTLYRVEHMPTKVLRSIQRFAGRDRHVYYMYRSTSSRCAESCNHT